MWRYRLEPADNAVDVDLELDLIREITLQQNSATAPEPVKCDSPSSPMQMLGVRR